METKLKKEVLQAVENLYKYYTAYNKKTEAKIVEAKIENFKKAPEQTLKIVTALFLHASFTGKMTLKMTIYGEILTRIFGTHIIMADFMAEATLRKFVDQA